MRPLLLLTLGLSACLIIDVDATEAPDATPPPGTPDASVINCPEPDPGSMMICGRVLDLSFSREIIEPVEVAFYDAVALVTTSPEDRPPPLLVTTVEEGGIFRSIAGNAKGIASPPASIAVTTDDLAGLPESWLFTSVTVPGQANGSVEVFAFATSRDSPLTAYEDTGALVAIFLDTSESEPGWLGWGWTPAGVTITEGGAVHPERDAYFIDDLRGWRTVLSEDATKTAGPGTAVYIGDGIATYSGVSDECSWPSHTVGHAPGLVVVQLFESSCP